MQISVNTLNGDIITFDAESTDTIGNVRAKILDMGFEWLPNMKWYLVYNSERLDDGRTFNDYNIQNETILNMEPMVFFVTTPNGKILNLKNINPCDTIECFKNMIGEKTGTPISDMRLIYKGKQLADHLLCE